MKPNVVAPKMTHTREDGAERNRAVRRLSRAILPEALELVRQGVERCTAKSSREALEKEAEALLRSMLDELKVEFSDFFLEPSAAALGDDDDEEAFKDELRWVERLGRDFAFAVAAFWSDLDMPAQGTSFKQDLLVANLDHDTDDELLAQFDLIAARFYVDKRGRSLLKTLHLLSKWHPPVMIVKRLPAMDYLDVGTYAPRQVHEWD